MLGPGAGLVIRGSSPADSRVFVDGIEIPMLYHLGGIQSVIAAGAAPLVGALGAAGTGVPMGIVITACAAGALVSVLLAAPD